MNNFKRTLRLLGLIVLLILASVGMGIGGAMPIPTNNRRQEIIEIQMDSEESLEEDLIVLNVI